METLSAEQEKLAHPSGLLAVASHHPDYRRTLLDGDLSLMPAHDISPFLAGMIFANFTSLLSVRFAITDDSDGWIVVLVTNSDPRYAVG